MAELKDYDVDNAVALGEPITIKFNNLKMKLTPEELVTKRVGVSKPFLSKRGTDAYTLYSYMWEPFK